MGIILEEGNKDFTAPILEPFVLPKIIVGDFEDSFLVFFISGDGGEFIRNRENAQAY